MSQKSEKILDISTAAGRVAWALAHVWHGSQSRMAADIGVDQSTISVVVRGKRSPGKRFMNQVAAFPMLNANWILNGLGEPLIFQEQPGCGGQYFCPVAGYPLPRKPQSCRGMLTAFYRPVAAPDFSEERYWLQVEIGDFHDKGFLRGDWLLMDAGRAWLDYPQLLAGQPCIVLTGRRNAQTCTIRLLWYDHQLDPPGKFAIDLMAPSDSRTYTKTRASSAAELSRELSDPTTPGIAGWNGKRSDEDKAGGVSDSTVPASTGSAGDGSGEQAETHNEAVQTSQVQVKVELRDIVAVAVKLERQWW